MDNIGGPSSGCRCAPANSYVGRPDIDLGARATMPAVAGAVSRVFFILDGDTASVDVERAGAVLEHIVRDRADEGLARDADRLPSRLHGGAPAVPLLGFRRSRNVFAGGRPIEGITAGHVIVHP